MRRRTQLLPNSRWPPEGRRHGQIAPAPLTLCNLGDDCQDHGGDSHDSDHRLRGAIELSKTQALRHPNALLEFEIRQCHACTRNDDRDRLSFRADFRPGTASLERDSVRDDIVRGVQHVCAAMRDQQRPINDNEDAKAVQLATAAMERLLNNAQGLVAQSG
jgi:hypothetical protein